MIASTRAAGHAALPPALRLSDAADKADLVDVGGRPVSGVVVGVVDVVDACFGAPAAVVEGAGALGEPAEPADEAPVVGAVVVTGELAALDDPPWGLGFPPAADTATPGQAWANAAPGDTAGGVAWGEDGPGSWYRHPST
jgi:hypothetical protein